MSQKLMVLVIILFGGVSFHYANNLSAVDQPEDMMIDNEGYEPDRKSPVSFSHLNHAEDYEVSCMQCHHEYRDGENVWNEGDPVKKCIECHSPVENQGEVKKLSIAFHKNCKACHRNLAKEGITKDAPYRQCTDCHEIES